MQRKLSLLGGREESNSGIEVIVEGKQITSDGGCFIVAEIGQNHQGSIDVAKKLIKTAKECGADCVKFQKTCLEEKFNKLALERPYLNDRSFGATYGDHKRYLELKDETFWKLQAYADSKGILFAATAMDLKSLQFLLRLKMPFIKIGSGDVNNPLLIEEAAKSNTPLIISTGMSNLSTVSNIYNCVKKYHSNFALLHCVSAYPTPPEEVNLKVIELYKEEFPDVVIGYSGHETGIDISVAAVVMGAKILERHITLNKTWRGSDHACSLEPAEFKEMVNKIRLVEKAFGHPIKTIYSCEAATIGKLRKVIVLSRSVKAGHTLRKIDLAVKVASPGGGIDGEFVNSVVGRKVKFDVDEDEPLMMSYLSDD